MSGDQSSQRVLILGGTGEGRLLAERLTACGVGVITSLAGRLSAPARSVGQSWSGGFGGAAGLTDWLQAEQIVAVVDASHPFAAQIGASAVAACATLGLLLLRLDRPPWQAQPGDRWLHAESLAEAACLTAEHGRRVLLAIGRQGVGAFASVADLWFLIRCIEPPDGPIPRAHELLLARGPFRLADERSLLATHRIDLVVTKNSGGPTDAKLIAARERGIPVVMVARPIRAQGETVSSVDEAVAWVGRVLQRRGHVEGDASEARRSR
ncbi:MAG: cobalt-precorrin-6A reductase [Chloroflexi bacterium]|nr:cobalt-precorrin-6A reductase [Chloroflexota bacterium]